MFLTPEEITALTLKQRRHAQHAVLNALGVDHKVRPDGTLAVLKASVEAAFGIGVESKSKRREPNWSAVKNG